MTDHAKKIAALAAACEKLSADLATADEKANTLREDYKRAALDRLSRSDTKGARAARQEIEEAQAAADDLRLALGQAQERLQQARDEQAAEIKEAEWNATEEAGSRYIDSVVELQDEADVLIERLLAVAPLAEQLVRLAPVRTNLDLTETQRIHDLRMYLTRLAGDRIGKLGVSVDRQFIERQPTLVEHARGHVMGLMSHKPAKKP